MPTRPLSPCVVSGCPGRAVDHGRCEEHARQRDQQYRERYPDRRPSASERGYGAEWRKVRDAFLAKHPYCAECERDGKQVKATDVDHKIARRKGGTDDPSNLESLCHRHHSAKTARVDGGGWRRERQTPLLDNKG